MSAEYPPQIGGIATFSYNLAKTLKSAGYDLKVITSVAANGLLSDNEVEVVRTPNFLNKKFLKLLPLLFNTIFYSLKYRPDRLLLMKWTHEGIIGYLIKKVFKIDYLLVAHGGEILLHQKKIWLRAAMKIFFSEACKIISNSNYTKQLVVALGIDAERVIVLHPALDVEAYPARLNTQAIEQKYGLKSKRVILTVARLTERKGQDQVIKILAQLKEKYPDLVYVITGDGEYKIALKELVSKYQLSDRVKMLGYVNSNELYKLYKICQVFIMPSRQLKGDVEGFGISFLEANLFGKPIIAGNSGGVADAVVDGVNGFLVDPYNLEEIKDKLVTLLENENLRLNLGNQGRKRVLNNFSLSQQIMQLEQIFGST